MGTIGARFSTDFDVLPKGTYLFEVKESGIEDTNPKEGGTVRRRYWVRLAVVGGECEGMTHLESFLSKTKDDFSFSKMFGFLVKLGVIPPDVTQIDTAVFSSDRFEDRFRRGLKGLQMGAKIGWRYKEEDKAKENPQSEMKTYYSKDEVIELLGKREAAKNAEPELPLVQPAAPALDEWGRPLAQPSTSSISTPPTPTTADAPKPKPPWE